MQGDIYPGKIVYNPEPTQIVWIGTASDHLYCVVSNGKTYRLDRIGKWDHSETVETVTREWVEVATIPL